jgi:hypothetical protein
MANVKINEGTATTIKTDTVGGIEYQVVKLDVGAAGASSLFTGTLSQVSKGTITALGAGTITGGTLSNLNFGTVDTYYLHPNAFATVVSTGTNAFGTIKAAVAGSAIYITDLIVSVGSATVVEIGDGTVGASDIIGSLQFAQYGGMVCNFRTPIKTSSAGTLVYKQSVGCPLSMTVIGFVK